MLHVPWKEDINALMEVIFYLNDLLDLALVGT